MSDETEEHPHARKRVEAIPEPELDPADAPTDPLAPLAGPLKPLELCPATQRPGHRYVGPYDHCGDCGQPAPESGPSQP